MNTGNTGNTAAIWRATLERLELAPVAPDAVCKEWLREAHLLNAPYIGADDIDAASSAQEQLTYFTLQVSNDLARDIINTRWRRSLEDILSDLTG